MLIAYTCHIGKHYMYGVTLWWTRARMRNASTCSWGVVWHDVESSCGEAQPWGGLQSFLSSLRDTFSHHTPWQNKQDLWWLENGQLSVASGRKRINKWYSIRDKNPAQKLLVLWELYTPTAVTQTPVCSIQCANKLNYCLRWRNCGFLTHPIIWREIWGGYICPLTKDTVCAPI